MTGRSSVVVHASSFLDGAFRLRLSEQRCLFYRATLNTCISQRQNSTARSGDDPETETQRSGQKNYFTVTHTHQKKGKTTTENELLAGCVVSLWRTHLANDMQACGDGGHDWLLPKSCYNKIIALWKIAWHLKSAGG